MYPVTQPFPFIADTDGTPLEGGLLYFGQPNQNPEVNPIPIYWDQAGLIPAEQPVSTIAGVPVRNGTPANVFCSGDFSLTVRNSKREFVYYQASSPGLQVQLSLQTALADTTSASEGAGLVGFSYSLNYAVATLGHSASKSYGIDITQHPFLADPTGVADAGPAIAAAAAAFPGIPLRAPAGTYRIATKPNIKTSNYDGAFGAGFKLFGDGPLKTVFINDISNDAMFDIDTDVDHATTFKGAIGTILHGFSVKRVAATTNGTAIKLRTSYNPLISQVSINGMSGAGIEIPCNVGDNDGSNMVKLQHVRVENCAGWGINAAGASGFNETSFIHMEHVFVQACGTASGAYQPPSGGMAWKGQILTMTQCAFTLNENCALWIPGQDGAAQSVDLQGTTFENNKARGLFCRGISMFKARNIQFYNNDSYKSTVACEFEGDSFVIRQIDIDGVVVRATAGNNPYTAFKLSGVNTNFDSCRVRNVTWDNFDYAGQSRFAGWQFDPIPTDEFILQVASGSEVYVRPATYIGKGNKIPLRLRGGVGGTPSTSGEWIAHELGTSGIFFNPGSLAATTRYWMYLYDDNGLAKLEASSTASQVTDPTSGYAVKSGDPTRFYVGSIITAGAGVVATTASGWLNPAIVPGSQVGANAFLWSDSTGRLRIKYAALPASDTDGTVVGTQV
jgi:hypothetical protein